MTEKQIIQYSGVCSKEWPIIQRLTLVLVLLLCFSYAYPSQGQSDPLVESQKFFSAGHPSQAARVLEKLLGKNPADEDAHLLLGQIYALQGRRAAAIDQLSKAIQLRPDSSVPYNALGTALSRFAEFPAASKAFEHAVALDPDLDQARIDLALTLIQMNDVPGAVRELQTVIQLHPKDPPAATAHYFMAKIYSQENDNPQAIAELTAATQILPSYAEAWFFMGKLERDVNHEATALSAFQRAAALEPKNPEYQYELGSEYLSQGYTHRAIVHLHLADSHMQNETVAVLYKLQRALKKEGATEEANRIGARVRTLIARDDQFGKQSLQAQSLDDQGIALEKQGKIMEAMNKYRAALELNPEQQGFRLNYALALCRVNRWKEGIDELREILYHDAGNVDARRALYIAEDKARQVSPDRNGRISKSP